MEKFLSFWCVLFFFCNASAQEQIFAIPRTTIKWAPASLLVGNFSLQAEYNLKNRHSFTAKLGIPAAVKHTITYQERKAELTMKATAFLAGFRTYFRDQHLAGFYFEPFFKYVVHKSTGLGKGSLVNKPIVYDFTNRYEGTGFGLQLGYQWRIKEKFIIDLFFFGPEINSSLNNFTAVEITQTDAWTAAEAAEAESVTREFLNGFPFIKNRFEVSVVRETRTIKADFIGAVPGVRTGVSIGFAF